MNTSWDNSGYQAEDEPYERDREDNAVGRDDDEVVEVDDDELGRIIKASNEQAMFFFDALKRNGVL